MHDREERRITSLEARVIRLEGILVQLLTLLETSGAAGERTIHMQTLLQQMHLSPDTSLAGIKPAAVTPQERPEMEAMRQALLSGDTIKALTLYHGEGSSGEACEKKQRNVTTYETY